MITGYIKTVDINEFSKEHKINENIKNQMQHVAWECDCGEINVNFEFKKNLNKFLCDNCKDVKQVNAIKKENIMIDSNEETYQQ